MSKLTPSQYMELTAEEIFKALGRASGLLVTMLVRRRLSHAALLRVRDHVRVANDKIDQLVVFSARIREN